MSQYTLHMKVQRTLGDVLTAINALRLCIKCEYLVYRKSKNLFCEDSDFEKDL